MKRIFFTICLIFLAFTIIKAQSISDVDRHGFDELEQIKIDVDGDGELDIIQPRTYQTYNRRRGKRLRQRDITNWIVFDLITSKGRKIKSFFRYNYGTAGQGGSYWVYALKSAGDVNKDGKIDLLFYSGDDTSDERIILLNKGNRFIVSSRKITDNSSW